MKFSGKLLPSILIILGCIVFSRLAIAEATPLRIGTFNVPPQMFLDAQGQHQGAAVEYFKILALRMELTDVVFKEYPLSRLISELEDGQIDAALFLAKDDRREAAFQFPAKSYFAVQSGIAVRSSLPLRVVPSIETLAGLRIGVIQDGYITPLLNQPAMTLKPLAGARAPILNLKKLMAGHLDAVYIPDINTLQRNIAQLGLEKELRVLLLPEPATPVYTVFSSKVPSDFVRLYESAIYEGDDQLYQKLLIESSASTEKISPNQ
jgi:polar amino acid transport system substrate-binding protein